MIDRRTKLLLLDMRDNAQLAITFLGPRDVGEAASKVDPAQRQQMPALPWRDAINMRNLLIHGYDRVKVEYVVDTVRNDFPPLIAEIDRVLSANP